MKTQDTYFIFGERASKMYYDGEPKNEIKKVIMRGDAELYHHKATDTLDMLLSAFCGYDSYVIISKEEYSFYSNKDMEEWAAVHYEIVSLIEHYRSKPEENQPDFIKDTLEVAGSTMLWTLAFDWTNEFMDASVDRFWDGKFFSEIETFVKNKVNNY